MLVISAAKKYSFQHSIRHNIKALAIPGKTIGKTTLKKLPHTLAPSTKAASSSSIGTALN